MLSCDGIPAPVYATRREGLFCPHSFAPMTSSRARFDSTLVLIGVPIFLWSTQAVLIKFLITEKAGPFELNVYRSLGAILFGLCIFSGARRLPRSFREYLPGLCLGVNFIVFNFALIHIDAYLLMVIETSSFVVGIALDRMMRVPTRVPVAAVVMTLVGLALLGFDAWRDGSSVAAMGLLFSVMTAITFALFNCTLRLIEDKGRSLLPLMLPVLFCNLPFAVMEISRTGTSLSLLWQGVLIVGVMQTGVVYLLWAKASAFFPGSSLCLFTLLIIPLTFAMEYFFLDLKFNGWQLAASAILCASVYYSEKIGAARSFVPNTSREVVHR